MSRYIVIIIMMVCGAARVGAQNVESVAELWRNPSPEYRMKTWWFFGYERTTDEGIVADVKALHDAGFGGVVYYDQNHAKDPVGNGAEEAFSESWWRHLHLAAEEARKAGLTFELNISNGYCAGGSWIDAAHAMQRVAYAETTVCGGEPVSVPLPEITGRDGYVSTIAVLAFPRHHDKRMRHFTARYNAKGKGRNGAMQGPLAQHGQFSGYGFEPLSDVGVLQVSDDSSAWRDVISLAPTYRSQGGYFVRTTSFPATAGRYWRVRYADGTCNYDGRQSDAVLKEWSVSSEAKTDRWEELTGLQSEFSDGDRICGYAAGETISRDSIINLTDSMRGDTLRCSLPQGEWTVLHLAAVPTGARSKHGRPNLLGYECDKLSKEAAQMHWDSYVQVILDSLNNKNTCVVEGVTMDSHEGGSQNWTPLMMQEFCRRRGYDFTPWLPTLAGYVVESEEQTLHALYDYRQTIADCVRDNYFGTFQQRAADNGLTFTAQAIGNALCITGDAISVKQVVDKPQGEFWTYQRQGAYDVKDCSSAAHLYGKPIASAEAMTDCEYKNKPDDLHRVANIAFSMGAQEFVVCATPHIPMVVTTEPYVAGREYAINRSNPEWQHMKPVWMQAARSMVLLRQGQAAPDALVFLGDDVPVKILTHRLPDGLNGLDWDACTADALRTRLSVVDGQLRTPDGVTYKALVMGREAHVTEQTRQLIDSLRSAGVSVLTSGEDIERPIVIEEGRESVVHTHRKTDRNEIYYIASTADSETAVSFRLHDAPRRVTLWHNMTGRCVTLKPSRDGVFRLHMKPLESVFVTY